MESNVYDGNKICMDHAKFLKEFGSGTDVYSYVASEIFDVQYDRMLLRHNKEYESKFMEFENYRQISKKICLMRDSVPELAITYGIPDLAEKIIKAFPYISEDETEPNLIDSYNFISWIVGFVRMNRFLEKNF